MAFTHAQVRKLAGKLPEGFVKTRVERGLTLAYLEGWHVIDEANRVFGFAGWDRETVSAECVWQDARLRACSYAVRVRIKVRAGKTIVAREGTGMGHGTGATLGEAHESALKEAETDATKRALITFGNRFGLALYDKAQAGVQRAKPVKGRSDADAAELTRAAGRVGIAGRDGTKAAVAWTLLTGAAPPQTFATPHRFCAATKATLRQAPSIAALEALWSGNAPTIAQLRAVQPELRTRNGTHYADLLASLYRQQRATLEAAPAEMQPATTPAGDLVSKAAGPGTIGGSPEAPIAAGVASAALATTLPRRVRDPNHLRRLAALPCLICGRSPSHAHHLRFAQLRSLGSKPSDEWTVPLCPLHHRALHDAGHEEEWWQAKGIDARTEAERLWRTTHGPQPATSTALPAAALETPPAPAAPGQAPKAPPVDDRDQPVPINLKATAPRLS
jgi:DNA recombination protein Rad52